MPKKATGLASSRGRGVRLALPGSFKQAGSSTQSGSSTQQPNPSGSSTQQQNPSSQTSKQTRADYAFPIQTLLALQDYGLTHLPKKTWADIASEEDEDESQTNLVILINQLGEIQTVESWIPADLKFFSSFSLAWVFSWQYKYGKQENKNYLPLLQRNAYVKWWAQIDASKINPTEKSKIIAALAASQSKESFAKKLQNILKLLQNDEAESSKRVPSSASSVASSGDINQNEDDCFGIDLGED
ncbi:hypothetical protein SESBI_48532 [Sesbania bispinosa]|nr:hypothetical protein SESBI_48532 [Sesbania bispinosa]